MFGNGKGSITIYKLLIHLLSHKETHFKTLRLAEIFHVDDSVYP